MCGEDLYKDVDVKPLVAEHEKGRKCDAKMIDTDHNVSQKKSYEQVVEDAHVTLTTFNRRHKVQSKALPFLSDLCK
ncbi:hypothetical protein Tco_0445750 [Tanacetum coccineum]